MAVRMLAAAVAALVLMACGGDGGGGSGPHTITKQDDGTTVEVTNGQTFTLDANVTTPFRWHLVKAPDAGVVEYVSSAYEASPNPEGLVGAGGTSNWTFQATGAGKTTIGLASVQIDARPPKQPDFSVTIDVTSA